MLKVRRRQTEYTAAAEAAAGLLLFLEEWLLRKDLQVVLGLAELLSGNTV